MNIEYAFGIFKGQQTSLTRLKLFFQSQKSYKFTINWITIYSIIHNLLLDIEDDWKKHKGQWISEEDDDHDKKFSVFSQKQQIMDQKKEIK